MWQQMHNRKFLRTAVTIVEMLVAMAIMAVIFTAILPLFVSVRNNWPTKQANAEMLQNGRVLVDHINQSLSKAVRITDVSSPSQDEGYIQFQDNDGNDFRYEVAADDYVQFGVVGSLSELAGPVSMFRFTCYDACDLSTPITDVDSIRFVKAEIALANSTGAGQPKTMIASTYLRTNGNCETGLMAWWKLDETSGLTATDSSGNGYNGTLVSMSSDKWTTGIIGGALEFDGYNDYVRLPIGSLISSLSDCTITTWVNWSASSSWQRVFDFGSSTSVNMFLTTNNVYTGTPRFAITTTGWTDEDQATAPEALTTGWHHIAVTMNPDSTTHLLYIDGEVVAQNTHARYTPSNLGTTTQNWLGRSQYWYDPYFDGLLDDVRIYDRVLSAAEVAELAETLKYQGFTEAKAGSDVTSITVSIPDTNQGDLLIAAVATDGDTSSSMAPPSGQGWTQIDIDDYSSEVTLGAWWKLAGASEPATHQFTWSGGQQAYAWMMRFTGHDTSSPIHAYSFWGGSSSTPTSPAVTTTNNNCLILRLGAFDDDDITVDSPGLSAHTAITMDESAASSAGLVTYQSFAEAKVSYDNTSIAISKPSGTTIGDLLIAAVATDGDSSSSLSAPGGGGWTLINRDDYDYDVTLGVWWKIAGASEPSSYTFTWSGSQQAYGWIMRFTGYHSTSPINTSATYGGIDTGYPYEAASPAVTTTVANCLILRIGGFDDDDVNVDDTGLDYGHYDITMDRSDTDWDSCSGGAGYKQQASIGSSGTVTFDLTGSEEYRTVTIAIAPAVGVGGTVSGGAGYVMQPSAGGSGTSTFSLGSSNEARTLTIAIAPNTEVGGSGDYGIRP